jgi:hypothetical protein
MSITATFEAGQIVLPPGVDWPEGTVLRIEPVKEQPTIWDKLGKYEGAADDLPPDLAANHNDYFRGHVRE